MIKSISKIQTLQEIEKVQLLEKKMGDAVGEPNFSLKELSPDMLNTIRKYLFVASSSWETKLTDNFSLIIKKSQTKPELQFLQQRKNVYEHKKLNTENKYSSD
jgi:hypothetical protein